MRGRQNSQMNPLPLTEWGKKICSLAFWSRPGTWQRHKRPWHRAYNALTLLMMWHIESRRKILHRHRNVSLFKSLTVSEWMVAPRCFPWPRPLRSWSTQYWVGSVSANQTWESAWTGPCLSNPLPSSWFHNTQPELFCSPQIWPVSKTRTARLQLHNTNPPC